MRPGMSLIKWHRVTFVHCKFDFYIPTILFQSFFIRCTRDGEPDFACQFNGQCDISFTNRSSCQACRYKKCLAVKMKRRGINFELHLMISCLLLIL